MQYVRERTIPTCEIGAHRLETYPATMDSSRRSKVIEHVTAQCIAYYHTVYTLEQHCEDARGERQPRNGTMTSVKELTSRPRVRWQSLRSWREAPVSDVQPYVTVPHALITTIPCIFRIPPSLHPLPLPRRRPNNIIHPQQQLRRFTRTADHRSLQLETLHYAQLSHIRDPASRCHQIQP